MRSRWQDGKELRSLQSNVLMDARLLKGSAAARVGAAVC